MPDPLTRPDEPQARVVADAGQRHRRFPLTDAQAAELLDRRSADSAVPRRGYGEFSVGELDVDRLTAAWRAMIERHDMLRAVVHASGSQQVLAEVPGYEIAAVDLAGLDGTELAAARYAVRAELTRAGPADRWPLFELRALRTADRWVVALAVDSLVCDLRSLRLLLAELHLRYAEPGRRWPAPRLAFRDHVVARRAEREAGGFAADREYWRRRLDEMPPPPELPTAPHPAEAPGRRRMTLSPADWAALRARAGAFGVPPSTVVLAAYAEVIGRWCRHPSFCLNLTLLDRPSTHPQVDELVGAFAAPSLLAVRRVLGSTFAERARAIRTTVSDDAPHPHCSGIDVARELAHRQGRSEAAIPIAFTSAIGLTEPVTPPAGSPPCQAGRTAGAWLECQAQEHDDGLSVVWDARDDLFPPGMVDEMADAHADLLRQLTAGDAPWRAVTPVGLPAAQQARRAAYNATAAPVPDGLLHDGAVAQALRSPERIALIGRHGVVRYGELLHRALGVAGRLLDAGLGPGEVVAVVMEKGVEQVVGVLGILLAGGAYLPIDATVPAARRDLVLANAGAVGVLTQSWVSAGVTAWPNELVPLAVDELPPAPAGTPLPRPRVAPGDLAYIIYTSGSAGLPKGVMIDHRGALNTVVDINTRFGLGPDDRVIALASLGFDLSVWDIFGVLAAGGAVVLPDHTGTADPQHWADLIAEHRVTVWNSVPAQLQMLVDYLESPTEKRIDTLRLAMLSGDWIPVTLPERARALLPRLSLISLGGATEASIWSIHFPVGEVDPAWPSIPYGRPLANQTFHVLDADLADRPEWVAGELYIGGVGVALGYRGDKQRTAEHFLTDARLGGRLYRTGDMGRFLPSGVIEFLGREDTQVKIHGHRIELAEVERALLADPAVGAAVVVVDGASR